MVKYTIQNIDDYKNKITDKQAIALIKHCNKYQINPEICAWYDNMKDFYSDWCSDNIKYSKEEAKDLIKTNEGGEFKVFKNGEIIRLVR